MKKTSFKIILPVLMLSIALVGCKKKQPDAMDNGNGGDNGIIADIAAALQAGQKMKCTVTDTNAQGQEIKVTTYFQGEKFRSETSGAQNGGGVFDGSTYYMWDDDSDTAIKMEKRCLDEIQSQFPQAGTQTNQFQSSEDLVQEKPDFKCNRVASIDLSKPNKDYTDMCALIKQQMEALKNIQFPPGTNIPNMPAF